MKITRIAFASLLLAGAACSSGSTDNGNATGILGKIASVQTSGGILATIQQGSVNAGQGGPEVTVPSVLSLINGGTGSVTISSASDIRKVAVAVDGVSNFYEVTLAPGQSLNGNSSYSRQAGTLTLLITLAQHLTDTSLPLSITVAGADGKYGTSKHLAAKVTSVGSGDVQISLSWDGPSDVDLHVTGPDTSMIYYGNRTSPTGGTLDLDSNPNCSLDNIDNENVTWPTGKAPSGRYTVVADYFSACGLAATHYVVTITVAGQAPQIFQGTFTGQGDFGSGGGRTITTFTK
jgi:hypothetical protein